MMMVLLSACGGNNLSTLQTTPVIIPPKVPMNTKPKNLILMIGDGMGLAQISAALYTNGNSMNLERFPVIGLHKSYL